MNKDISETEIRNWIRERQPVRISEVTSHLCHQGHAPERVRKTLRHMLDIGLLCTDMKFRFVLRKKEYQL